MSNNTPEEIIEEITHSHDVDITEQELTSSRRKVFNKYMVAVSIVALIALFTYLFLSAEQLTNLQSALHKDNYLFYWMLLVGFSAEIVAGSMGMGYGVICTTILLILNVPPPVISASIHSAESFTSAAGSISHWQLGNINKKLAKALAIPAIIGAVIGALLLSYVGERYAKITKPFIAIYTMYLGIRILQNAFQKKENNQKKEANKNYHTWFNWRVYRFVWGRWLGAVGNRNIYKKWPHPTLCNWQFYICKMYTYCGKCNYFYFYYRYPSLEYCCRVINWRHNYRTIFGNAHF
jgi:uncharacterized membrane protein YqgA involved in biofilm formation